MAKGRKTKRVVVIGDMHCGHRAGLTPPGFMLNPDNENDAKWRAIQEEQWKWFCETINMLRPIDRLIVMGDCVDGRSERAEGRDCIRPGRRDQVEMAFQAIQFAAATKISMVYGTRYHVADWEDDLCAMLGDKAKIGSHEWKVVNGLVFDIKHMVGGSGIPHGRVTPLLKARLWNSVWSSRGQQPDADVLIRGHVHYYDDAPWITKRGLGRCFVCPPLQGPGSEYGAERCEGVIDYGLIRFDITPSGGWTWEAHLADLKSHTAHATEF